MEILILTAVSAFAACSAYKAFEPYALLSFWGRVIDKMAISRYRVLRVLASPMGGCLMCLSPWLSLGVLAAAWALGFEFPIFAWVAVPIATPAAALAVFKIS